MATWGVTGSVQPWGSWGGRAGKVRWWTEPWSQGGRGQRSGCGALGWGCLVLDLAPVASFWLLWGPPCACCVGPVSVLICFGVKPNADSQSKSRPHSTGEKACRSPARHRPPSRWLPRPSLLPSGSSAVSSVAASWVPWVPGLAAGDAASVWGWSLDLATEVQHLVQSQGLASASFLHHRERESCPMEARGGSVAPSCPRAWSPQACPMPHTPARPQAGLPAQPAVWPSECLLPLPGPREALALASFWTLKPEVRPPPGTVLCTPLRPTHELFLEHVGSVLSSLVGLPGCWAAARTLPPAAGAVPGSATPQAPLVQTASCAAVCARLVAVPPGGPALLPSFLLRFLVPVSKVTYLRAHFLVLLGRGVSLTGLWCTEFSVLSPGKGSGPGPAPCPPVVDSRLGCPRGCAALGPGLSSGPGSAASKSTAQVSVCPETPRTRFSPLLSSCPWFRGGLAAVSDLSLPGSVMERLVSQSFSCSGQDEAVTVSPCGRGGTRGEGSGNRLGLGRGDGGLGSKGKSPLYENGGTSDQPPCLHLAWELACLGPCPVVSCNLGRAVWGPGWVPGAVGGGSLSPGACELPGSRGVWTGRAVADVLRARPRGSASSPLEAGSHDTEAGAVRVLCCRTRKLSHRRSQDSQCVGWAWPVLGAGHLGGILLSQPRRAAAGVGRQVPAEQTASRVGTCLGGSGTSRLREGCSAWGS